MLQKNTRFSMSESIFTFQSEGRTANTQAVGLQMQIIFLLVRRILSCQTFCCYENENLEKREPVDPGGSLATEGGTSVEAWYA